MPYYDYWKRTIWVVLSWIVFFIALVSLSLDDTEPSALQLRNGTLPSEKFADFPDPPSLGYTNHFLLYDEKMSKQNISLEQIFTQLNRKLNQRLSSNDVKKLFQLSQSDNLKKLQVNDHFHVRVDDMTNEIVQIRHSRFHATSDYHYQLSTRLLDYGSIGPGMWSIQPHDTIPETLIHYASFEVKDSILKSSIEAGIPPTIISQLSNIFSWEIDLSDIQAGDQFRLAWEAVPMPMGEVNEVDLPGSVLFAQIITKEGSFELFKHYENDNPTKAGYFSASGEATKGAFLRTPLKNYIAISSRFNLNRTHPITHKIRAHKGIDYAADINTPVIATADGVVVRMSSRNDYGNYIILQHDNGYRTLYAHLNKFAPSLTRKYFVEQGDVIGTVGTTGLSTGPHLHYEFLVENVHVDPALVEFPADNPLLGSEKLMFMAFAQQWKLNFDLLSANMAMGAEFRRFNSTIDPENTSKFSPFTSSVSSSQ